MAKEGRVICFTCPYLRVPDGILAEKGRGHFSDVFFHTLRFQMEFLAEKERVGFFLDCTFPYIFEVPGAILAKEGRDHFSSLSLC